MGWEAQAIMFPAIAFGLVVILFMGLCAWLKLMGKM